MDDNPPRDSLFFRIDGKERYTGGEPVTIIFTLSSTLDQDIWILSWLTPLEGLKGDILSVRCRGREISYEGMMMKRGEPTAGDYIKVRKNQPARQEIDISRSYPLPPADGYTVEFRGRVLDCARDERDIPRKQAEQKILSIRSNTLMFSIER